MNALAIINEAINPKHFLRTLAVSCWMCHGPVEPSELARLHALNARYKTQNKPMCLKCQRSAEEIVNRSMAEAINPKGILRQMREPQPLRRWWKVKELSPGKWLAELPVGKQHVRQQKVLFKLIKTRTPGLYELYFYHSVHGIMGSAEDEVLADSDAEALQKAEAEAMRFFAKEGFKVTEAVNPKDILRQIRPALENPWGPAWHRELDGSWKAQPLSNRCYKIINDVGGFRLVELWRGAMTGKWKVVYDKLFSTAAETKAHFPARLREAVNPKGILRGIRQVQQGKMLGRGDSISVFGRRWFRRGYGGTYHTATIYVNDLPPVTTPRQYGYGDQYLETAWQWLEHEGYVPKREHHANGGMDVPWRAAQELGIALTYSVMDVKRQRDL